MNRLQAWFRDTQVRNKILLGYAVILSFMVLILVAVLVQTERIRRISAESSRAATLEQEAARMDAALNDRVASFRDFLISGQPTALQQYAEADSAFRRSLRAAEALVLDGEQEQQLRSVRSLADEWQTEVAVPGVELREETLRPGGPPVDTIVDFVRTGVGRRNAASAQRALNAFQEEQARIAREMRLTREEALSDLRWIASLFTLTAAVLGFLVATWLARRIAASVRQAVDFVGSVAEGNLARRLEVESRDEFGELIGTLNRMAGDLRATIGGVTSAATQVASAAEEIAAASEQISYTSDQQVRSTEETSSSMEEIAAQIARVARSAQSLAVSVDQTSSSIAQMSGSIEQTATSTDALGTSVEETSATIEQMVASITQAGRHVEETRGIARDAESNARDGGDAVERTVKGMRRIHSEMERLVETIRELGASSEAIGRVSEVIEDIADQTNLLALNASIEAARAGEHGRGFAVVAQEIRRLAERAVESTREITTTIRGVMGEVQRVVGTTGDVAERSREGIQLADQAGQALDKIIDSAGRTRDLMEEVSLATQQQINAAEQAQDAIRHIHRVTEEARIATREQATGSRQIVEAVENMNRQTQEVFAATEEQKRGGEMILQSTENINQGARATQEAIEEMAGAAQELSSQANRLSELVATFRV